MIITTTDILTGFEITEYLGIARGTYLYTTGGIVDTPKKSYQKALKELEIDAKSIGADAVIGVQFNQVPHGACNQLTFIGTAIKCKKI